MKHWKIALQHERATIVHGDAANYGATLVANSVDAIVTDPPAGIGFMAKEWDHDRGGREQWIEWLSKILALYFKALKPGGHALVWALPRTSDWTIAAIRRAGFEIRDQIHDVFDADILLHDFIESLNDEQRNALERLVESQASPMLYHLFGSGFPKSLDVSKAIDAALVGVNQKQQAPTRPVLGLHPNPSSTKIRQTMGRPAHSGSGFQPAPVLTASGSSEAAKWSGFGTALKPAVEHWVLARKPLDGTVAANVLKHGIGGLNIDACRVGYADDADRARAVGPQPNLNQVKGRYTHLDAHTRPDVMFNPEKGRWPAHVVLDETTARWMDRQNGTLKSGVPGVRRTPSTSFAHGGGLGVEQQFGDSGGASRFFYIAKVSRRERNEGLRGDQQNTHPCVKSISLMRWLVRLVTPPGGLVVDPFGGSGSTLVAAIKENVRCLLVEKEDEYIPIAVRRAVHALRQAGFSVRQR